MRLRRWYWRHVRRHDGEICEGCGRPVDRTTGRSYWLASDDLWAEVNGQFAGIKCIPCFTTDAARRGVPIHWRAARESDPADASDDMVDRAAFELYAGGPWGEFVTFLDDGTRAITDAHSMNVYREIVRTALRTALDG